MPALKRHYPLKTRFKVLIDGCKKFGSDECRNYLKSQGVTLKFKGETAREPKIPSKFSDFFPIENNHSMVDTALEDYVAMTPKWRDGVLTSMGKPGEPKYEKVMGEWEEVCQDAIWLASDPLCMSTFHETLPQRRDTLRKTKGKNLKY